MNERDRPRINKFLLALCLFATTFVFSQTAATPDDLTLKSTSRLVVVDIIATDHRNAPVTDLRPSDFIVLEDGNEQAVKIFELHAAAATSERAVIHKAGPNVFSNSVAESPGPLTVLLLDGLNTRLVNQSFAREQLLSVLTKLPSASSVAVYLLGSRLQLLQDFTSDPALLRQVVLNAKNSTSPLMENPVSGPVHAWMEGVPLTPQMREAVREFQRETDSNLTDLRVDITLAALRSIARSLTGYRGRKRLIWISETFPLDILTDKGADAARQGSANRGYGQALATTASLLADAEVAVYPIDARGLMPADFFTGTTQYDSNGVAFGASHGRGLGAELDVTSDELTAAQGTMQHLADHTGGRAFYNQNDVDAAIRESLADGSTYYTLGYYPSAAKWDGSFRKIRVKVNRDGVKLRYRLGYFAIDPKELSPQDPKHYNAEFDRQLMLDTPMSTAVRIDATIHPPSTADTRVQVDYAVGLHSILSTPAKAEQALVVDCAARVYSRKDMDHPLLTTIQRLTGTVTQQALAKLLQSGLPCHQEFSLPKGEYVLRLGVLDHGTGLIGTVDAYVAVP